MAAIDPKLPPAQAPRTQATSATTSTSPTAPTDQPPLKRGATGFESVRAKPLSITGRFRRDGSPLESDPALLGDVAKFRNSLVAQSGTAKSTAKEVGGFNTGALGDKDPVVPAARRDAKKVAGDKVDWKNPEKTLNHLSQFDAGKGGNDAVRCGAAVLVAGAVLKGPEQFQKAMDAVSLRAGSVAGKYTAMAEAARAQADKMAEPAKSQVLDFARQADEFGKLADDAAMKLEKLAAKDPKTLTQADLQAAQEAVYVSANLDQRIISDKKFDPGNDQKSAYLTVGAMKTYGQLMWGSDTTKLDGKKATPMLVDNGQGGGHFVLAHDDGNVAYNPWPQKDGTAYVRSADGDGAKVGKTAGPDTLAGNTVGSFNVSLPSRD